MLYICGVPWRIFSRSTAFDTWPPNLLLAMELLVQMTKREQLALIPRAALVSDNLSVSIPPESLKWNPWLNLTRTKGEKGGMRRIKRDLAVLTGIIPGDMICLWGKSYPNLIFAPLLHFSPANYTWAKSLKFSSLFSLVAASFPNDSHSPYSWVLTLGNIYFL